MAFLGYSIGTKNKLNNDAFKRAFEIQKAAYNLDFACVGIRNL